MGSISRGDVAGVCVEALRNDAGRVSSERDLSHMCGAAVP
jgi:hypothetical protein